jgi:asparagine synthase (glutamine-hydrolysing)
MCGIAGQWGGNGHLGLEASVRRMADALRHRGPDDAGVWVDEATGIGLGHRRLAVLDLSPAGHQPMVSGSGRFVIAFNGEIYNHLELRGELEGADAAPGWRGHSDTETLLAGFEHWGIEPTLKRAVGMFALALWDRDERSLHLARDRFGEKPLYYGWAGVAFVFGSELKALRAYPGFDNPVDRDALALYMQFCTVPAPYSIYQDVFKLEPGCVLTLPASGLAERDVRIAPYWSFGDAARRGLAEPISDEVEAIDALESVLKRAVAAQSVADVPLGAFLSGGVDSSVIVALMQAQSSRPVQTFTVGFDEGGFDESPHAQAVAAHLGTEHHALRVSAGDARAVIPALPTLYDEPFADSSQIPTHLVCRAARSRVTVALSGDAGDEVFGGYNRYVWGPRVWKRMGRVPLPLRRALGAAAMRLSERGWDRLAGAVPGRSRVGRPGFKVHKLAGHLRTTRSLDDLYRGLVSEWPADSGIVIGARRLPIRLDDTALVAGIDAPEQRMMLWDTLTYLPDDILTKVDRAAMGVSLETRVPFLDHRVVELAWRLPLHMKIRNGQGKWALRQVLYKYVPRELIERPKAGFAIPVGEWLRGPLREWAEALLDERRLAREGYLNPAPIRAVWAQHLSGRYDWTLRLWCVLMFQAWLEANS